MTFDQGRDVAVPRPGQEIALPMPRHRPIFNRCRSLTDRDEILDLSPSIAIETRPLRSTNRALRSKVAKVLISAALSPAAVQIFKDRGIEVDFQPSLGKDKDKLAELIGGFDRLAIRSATKVSAKILEKAKNLKVIGS